jgi:hypothetical protein
MSMPPYPKKKLRKRQLCNPHCISIQRRYKVYGVLRVKLRDILENPGDLVYLCDRLQVGFREFSF